ncbi:MAG: cation-translocating P-type ATPase [Kiritimatiellae bacterium]|nr:cation-translocating P-type ATPase [Kiritimatiellia bacterium]
MSEPKCIVHRLAKILAKTEELRAVFFDANTKRISFASAPGSNTESAQSDLEQLAGQYKPEDLPACAEPPWQLSCATCAQSRSHALPEGVRLVTLPGSGLLIERESATVAPQSWKWKQFQWTLTKAPVSKEHKPHDTHWKWPLVSALLCGALGLAGFLIERFASAHAIAVGFYLAAYISGAWFIFPETWERMRRGVLDVHFLMIAVAIGAALIGHWWEGAALLFLFSFSHTMEEIAEHRTEHAISGLFKDAPTTATVLAEDGSEQRIPVEDLQPGQILAVRPGEMFPVDAQVINGTSAADESNLTGESIPVDKTPGERALAGTMNLWGRLDVRVLKPAAESSLSKVINLIQNARESKAPAQRFTDRFGSKYTYFVLVMCIAMFFVWWKFFAYDGKTAFYRTMTLLVVSSPCALVLSIPSAVLAGIAASARRGILFRGGIALENLAKIRRVALDKTGTLTTGNLRVIAIEPQSGVRDLDLLAAAAALATHSNHPVSQALARQAAVRKLAMPEVEKFRSETGNGLSGQIGGHEAVLGRRSVFASSEWAHGIAEPPIGTTEVLFAAGPLRGRFLLQDEIREASRPLLAHLRDQGLAITMLTGDRPEAANAIAHSLGVAEVEAGLKPEDKVNKIRAWTAAGERPAMIGDGVNDAPSLAAAYVGVAMGMRGADAALEEADIILTKDRLDRFSLAYEVSRHVRRVIYQNLVISLGSVVVLVAGAFAGWLPLTIGVIGHEGSTVIVLVNSLRLLVMRFKEDSIPA